MMFWRKPETAAVRVLLVTVIILCCVTVVLLQGAWIEVNGCEIDVWRFIQNSDDMLAAAGVLQQQPGWQSFIRTVCFLQIGCSGVFLFVIYELCRRGNSTAIYGAVFAVMLLAVLLWLYIFMHSPGETGVIKDVYFIHVRMNMRAWISLITVCAADAVYSVMESEKNGE